MIQAPLDPTAWAHGAQLQRLICATFPVIRPAAQVGNSNNADGIYSDAVKNAMGETVNKAAPELFVSKGLEVREGSKEPKGFVECTKKFVAEPDRLVPGIIELCLRRRQESDLHRLSRYFAITDS